jgi:dienelactone hydrolase
MSPKSAAIAPLANLTRTAYDKDAAEDAWQRIFAFFGQHLAG